MKFSDLNTNGIKDALGGVFSKKRRKVSTPEEEKSLSLASGAGWKELGASEESVSKNTLWFAVALEKNAENVSSVNIVLRSKSDRTREVIDHEFLRKLARPNSMMSGKTFVHLMYMQYILYGNVYINKRAENEWVLVDPNVVTTTYNDPTEKLYPRSYIINGISVSPEDIYHYKSPDGTAYINKIKPFLDINEALVLFTKAFYRNGGFIGDVIKTDATSTAQLRQIREGYDDSHRGSSTANKTLFLPRGTDVVLRQSGGGNKQATEERRSNRDEILAAMGLPKHVLGVTETGASRADSDAKQFAYFLNTIQPAAQSIYDFFTNKVLPDYSGEQDLYIDTVSQIEGDRDQSREDAVALLGSKNTKAFGTFNEARNLMNLPPIEGGDIIPSSNVITPNDPSNPGEGEISETDPIPVNPDNESGIFDVEIKYKENTLVVPDRFDKDFDKMTRKLVSAIHKKKDLKCLDDCCDHNNSHQKTNKQFTDAEIAEARKQSKEREKVVANEFGGIERGMKRIFASQRDYAVRLFELRLTLDFDRVKNVENDPYIDEEESNKKVVALLVPLITRSVEKVGAVEFPLLNPVTINPSPAPAVLAPLASPKFAVTESMAASILEYSQLSARSISLTTNRTIQNVIIQGLRNGDGLDVIRRRIHNSFDYFETWRARRTAKTATFFGSNMAGYEAMRQSGRVKTTKWYNPSPCQYCANFNGRVVEIGKTYAIRGETVLGTEGGTITVWKDTFFPPIHPSCQCALLIEESN